MRRGAIPDRAQRTNELLIAAHQVGSDADTKPLHIQANLFQQTGLPQPSARQYSAHLRLAGSHRLRDLVLSDSTLAAELSRCQNSCF